MSGIVSLHVVILSLICDSFLQEYKAVIKSVEDGPMAKVTLHVSQHDITRWVSPSMILGRVIPQKQSTEPNQR